MANSPRVAFFPDSFEETNGVARTSRALADAARRRHQPLLCVHATSVPGTEVASALALPRGPVSFALDRDLRHDLLFWRHARAATDAVRAFGANIVHVTGPSDVGQLGVVVARRLRLPIVASWHTNVHEYAERRLQHILRRGPRPLVDPLSACAGHLALNATLRFYRLASACLAPNPELVDLLHDATGAPTFLMRRGVDTTLFSPDRRVAGRLFTLGYVGRLSVEKNVARLASLDAALAIRGAHPRWLIVGDGAERPSLQRLMPHADFRGVLTGSALADAYAEMDLLVFPSETDTFGNVVLEALASGVPALVSRAGGPKFIVRDGVTGFVAGGEHEWVDAVTTLMADDPRRLVMRDAARAHALTWSWDAVLDEVRPAWEAALGERVPAAAVIA